MLSSRIESENSFKSDSDLEKEELETESKRKVMKTKLSDLRDMV